MPSELLFGKQENLEIGGQRYHRSVFYLGPWQRVRRVHQVRSYSWMPPETQYTASLSLRRTGGEKLG